MKIVPVERNKFDDLDWEEVWMVKTRTERCPKNLYLCRMKLRDKTLTFVSHLYKSYRVGAYIVNATDLATNEFFGHDVNKLEEMYLIEE